MAPVTRAALDHAGGVRGAVPADVVLAAARSGLLLLLLLPLLLLLLKLKRAWARATAA
jgi:hypothetical protein